MGGDGSRNRRMAERIGAAEVRYPFSFVIAFDHHVRDGVRFVMSGGGGAALYLSYREAAGPGRGALFHAVEITMTEAGAAGGRVFQAFAPRGSAAPFTFGAPAPRA